MPGPDPEPAPATSTPAGYVAVDGAQITEVGPGPVPERLAGARQIDAAGCLATPGWSTPTIISTSGRPGAGRSTPPCFGWLTELYPVWARIDEQIVRAAATAALTWLARSGCTTTIGPSLRVPAGRR